MAKRNNDQIKLIKINPLNNSDESLIAIAILNALTILEAEKNELVKIPERKELTKLVKNAKLDNILKALDEVNNIRIRKVPCMEATGPVGIVYIDHPIRILPCLIYRKPELKDGQMILVNSGLGGDEIIIDEELFNNKLVVNEQLYSAYQIFLNTGTKNIFKDKELSCNSCNRLHFASGKEDICLYDNTIITDCNQCCNKFTDCFKWQQPKGEE